MNPKYWRWNNKQVIPAAEVIQFQHRIKNGSFRVQEIKRMALALAESHETLRSERA